VSVKEDDSKGERGGPKVLAGTHTVKHPMQPVGSPQHPQGPFAKLSGMISFGLLHFGKKRK